LFTSFLSIAAVAVSLRYELGIISAHDEREASQLAFLSVLFSVPLTLIMAPVLLSTGAFGSLRYWEIRRERYAVVSRSAVMQHGGRSAFQVLSGFFRAGTTGLLLGELLGRCM